MILKGKFSSEEEKASLLLIYKELNKPTLKQKLQFVSYFVQFLVYYYPKNKIKIWYREAAKFLYKNKILKFKPNGKNTLKYQTPAKVLGPKERTKANTTGVYFAGEIYDTSKKV